MPGRTCCALFTWRYATRCSTECQEGGQRTRYKAAQCKTGMPFLLSHPIHFWTRHFKLLGHQLTQWRHWCEVNVMAVVYWSMYISQFLNMMRDWKWCFYECLVCSGKCDALRVLLRHVGLCVVDTTTCHESTPLDLTYHKYASLLDLTGHSSCSVASSLRLGTRQ